MIRRFHLVSLVALSAVALPGEASAEMVVPAVAGMPANSSFVNPPAPLVQIWSWVGDYIKRPPTAEPPPDPPPPARAVWVIPLTYEGDGTNYAWWASVMVSTGTRCSLKWRGATLPSVGLTTTTTVEATMDGPLVLTEAANCPGGEIEGCTNNLTAAFVFCSLVPGGYVGAVTYLAVPAPPTPTPLPPPGD